MHQTILGVNIPGKGAIVFYLGKQLGSERL